MNISISLLSIIVLHLSILAFAFKKSHSLLKQIVPMHLIPIAFCLITTITYLFKEELSPGFIQINIRNTVVVVNIPECLLIITLIITFFSIVISWSVIFNFLDEIAAVKMLKRSK